MFCPQCGQQQVSDKARFCSRCGFPLSGVARLLASGGLEPPPQISPPDSGLTPRQRGVRQGAMLMLSTVLVVPVVIFLLVAALGFPGELIPLTAVFCVMGGLLRIVYALMFEDATLPRTLAAPEVRAPGQVAAPPRSAALPVAQGEMAPGRGSWRQGTRDLAPPPSVTEATTRMLNDEPLPREPEARRQ
jgi:hypothetical protein